jgi:hypothetical protein
MFSISSGDNFAFFFERERYFFKIVPLGLSSSELVSSEDEEEDDEESVSL